MNLHVFCIHISLMLLLQYALSKTVPEVEDNSETEIGESMDNERSINIKHEESKEQARRERSSGDVTNRKQCAVMYKNDEPVGIIQANNDGYRFLPIHTDEQIEVEISPFADSKISSKRETSENDDDADDPQLAESAKNTDDSSQFSDERYPYIFAKFKVDSRIEKADGIEPIKAKSLHKRESNQPILNKRHSDSLSSALSKIELNDEAAEVELKSILNDMGLIDNVPRMDKREAALAVNEEQDRETTNKMNLVERRENVAKNEPNYGRLESPEAKLMDKDENSKEYSKEHLEQSENQENKNVEKRSDDMADKIKQEIQNKLQKIKEEVRDEINKIKNVDSDGFEEEDEAAEDRESTDEKTQRKKRNIISSLVDEETSDIDPVINGDNSLIPHVRRRRSINDEEYFEHGWNGLLIPPVKQYPGRKLQEYDDHPDVDEEEDFTDFNNLDNGQLQREKKGCKCNNGARDCKCQPSKSPKKGANFVYVDDVLHIKNTGEQMYDNKQVNTEEKRSFRNRRKFENNLKNGGYTLDIDPDIYRIAEEDLEPFLSRRKRESIEDLVAIHGGGPVINHLIAIRERSMLPRARTKRAAKTQDQTEEQLTLNNMSDEDLFGALPQGYEGERARYKRI